ncbi:MAG: helix-turn-helix transcriptional regulator [Clostridia bacterium]|nr:helix-turn-helix transcriptional regulator [Clostridia bacterium]
MKNRIQRELEKKGKTIYYLHQKIGGNRTMVYNVVKGFSRATGPQREKIAAFLEVPEDELFDENGMAKK